MKRPTTAVIDCVFQKLARRQPVTMLGSFAGRRSAFQILIGTILSARSRDEMTVKVCERLFRRYPNARRLAAARPRELVPILLISGARRLTGESHRAFLAEITRELCDGSPGLAERRFGWGRETVCKGLCELEHQVQIVD